MVFTRACLVSSALIFLWASLILISPLAKAFFTSSDPFSSIFLILEIVLSDTPAIFASSSLVLIGCGDFSLTEPPPFFLVCFGSCRNF